MPRSSFSVAGLALAVAFAAPPAGADTLAEAFASAYATNPTLDAVRAQVRQADELVSAARAGYRPDVQGQLTLQLDRTDRENAAASTSTPRTAAVQATQTLYDGGRTRNQIDSAISGVSQGRAGLASAEQTVLLNVVTTFMNVRRDQQFVSLAKSNVRLIREQLRAAEDRFAVGEVTRTDVSQARARLAEARSVLAAQEGQLVRSRQAYRRVVGNPPGALAEPPPLPVLPVTLEDAIAIAMSNHPDIAAAQFAEESARSDVKAAISNLLPQVTLQGTVTVDQGRQVGDATSGTIQLQAVVPIYQGGAEYAEIRRQKEIVSQRRAEIRDETRTVLEAVENAWSDLEVSRIAIRAGRQQVAAARIAFEGVREEAKLGARTTIDVLDAEQELLDARTDLVNARRDEYVAAYTVLAAVGDLTANYLGVAVELYNPEVHYDEVNDRLIGFEKDELTRWSKPYRP